MTVACVLRSGGDFSPEWVHALQAGVREHGDGCGFLCLTDMAVPWVYTQPLDADWPGWWAKMEIFRPGRFDGLVLYMDLDTLPVGSLADFATYAGEFAMIDDFYRPQKAQSGVMLFRPGPVTTGIWEAWSADPEGHMQRFRGDGEWLARHTQSDRIQALFPGQLVSLKVDARQRVPDGARLVCGHGQPRFSALEAGWAHDVWAARAA